jgi:hypothetical protein
MKDGYIKSCGIILRKCNYIYKHEHETIIYVYIYEDTKNIKLSCIIEIKLFQFVIYLWHLQSQIFEVLPIHHQISWWPTR